MAADNFDGPKLKQLRKRARLTQLQVVEMAGISETTICYVERGERRPQSRTLQKLLNLYAQRMAYFRQIAERLETDHIAIVESEKRMKERVGQNVQGKVNPETPEWKRSTAINHGGNIQTPVGSRPLPQPQGVSGVQRNR